VALAVIVEGNRVKATATVRVPAEETGALTNLVNARFLVRDADDDLHTYTLGVDAEVSHPGPGTYELVVDGDEPGDMRLRFEGDDLAAGLKVSEEGVIVVTESEVLDAPA
jgi:hypothetical protein